MKNAREGINVKRGVSGIVKMILLLIVCIPFSAFAVSYPPQLYHQEERHGRFVKGDTVYMFQSGTDDVKNTIHVNDTLTVYRIAPSCEMTPVGIIRVTAYVGETHLKGEVFAGEIRPDDIAKKESVSCLVISAAMCKK